MDVSIFYGVVEAFHLDIVLSIIIHITLRDKINPDNQALNLFSIFLLAVMSLGLMVLYIFMGFKVRRLTQSFFKFVVLEVKDMKDEPWRFLLGDKQVKGNVFQRHFNLINLLKDILFCVVLFFAYDSPMAVTVILFLAHLPLCVLILVKPPFLVAWENRLLQINSVFYVLIDVGFLVNIGRGDKMSPETRYYYLGFTLIVLVGLLIITNVGFNTYYGIKEAWTKFKKWRERRKSKISPNKSISIQQYDLGQSGESSNQTLSPSNIQDLASSTSPSQGTSTFLAQSREQRKLSKKLKVQRKSGRTKKIPRKKVSSKVNS